MTTTAYQAGRYARLAARGQDTCPRYGITPEARQEVAQWRRGWEDQDREMAARRTTSPQRPCVTQPGGSMAP